MQVLCPVVQCGLCNHPPTVILLPYPNPPNTYAHQPEWPKKDWKAYIACHECGNVSECLAQVVHWASFRTEFLESLHQRQAFYVAEIKCGEAGCGTPIKMHFYTGSGTTTDDVIQKIATANVFSLRCPSGHEVDNWREIEWLVEPETGPIES